VLGLYRRAVLLYPAAFRAQFGADMEQVVRTQVTSGESVGWTRVFVDLFGSALVQRWEAGHMRKHLAVIGFIVLFVFGGTMLVTGAGASVSGGLFALAMLALVAVIYGVATIVGRRGAMGAEHDYAGSRRFRWWWVPAALLAAFQLVFMVGQEIDDPKPENLLALLVIGAFSALVFAGMRIRDRQRGNWMIATGVLPMLPFIWVVVPPIVSLLVIVMALSDNIRMSRRPRPAV
jgi:hypothetical protein